MFNHISMTARIARALDATAIRALDNALCFSFFDLTSSASVEAAPLPFFFLFCLPGFRSKRHSPSTITYIVWDGWPSCASNSWSLNSTVELKGAAHFKPNGIRHADRPARAAASATIGSASAHVNCKYSAPGQQVTLYLFLECSEVRTKNVSAQEEKDSIMRSTRQAK